MTPDKYTFVAVPTVDGTYEMRPVYLGDDANDGDALERQFKAECGLIFLTVAGMVIFCGALAITWLLMSLIL